MSAPIVWKEAIPVWWIAFALIVCAVLLRFVQPPVQGERPVTESRRVTDHSEHRRPFGRAAEEMIPLFHYLGRSSH
jgi:hypothetical protein